MNFLNNLYNKIKNPSYYIIDIGASSGVNTDPVYNFIIDSKYKGLCIEGDKIKANELKTKTNFDIYNEYIYPHNIINIFSKFNVPNDIDILKIDIDGFDLEVLRNILNVYKPKIIIAEINEKIPPPILFEVIYKENYEWDFSHCFGFSIKSGEKVMNNYGYKIIHIYDLNNILCINEDLYNTLCINEDLYNTLNLDITNNVEELYKNEYINNLERHYILPWNENVNYWLEIKDVNLLKSEIINYFCNNNDRSTAIVKNKIIDIDFIINT
jgi:hypothetical protein